MRVRALKCGQHRHTVFESLAFANRDLGAFEVDVFYAQAHALHDAHAGAVHHAQNQTAGPARMR